MRLDDAYVNRIVQLSDTHLMASPGGGTFFALYTENSVAALCRSLAYLSVIDALLLTGDLVVYAMGEAYQRLDQVVSALGVPSFWLSENHNAV